MKNRRAHVYVLVAAFGFGVTTNGQTRVDLDPGQIGPVITAASTITVPPGSGQYAGSPWFAVTGSTAITSVTGLSFPGEQGTLTAISSGVSFVAGTGIGANCNPTQGNTYVWYYDGNNFWVVGPGCSSQPPSPCTPGFACDALWNSLGAACTAASGPTLLITRAWTGLASLSLPCPVDMQGGGLIQPASGQTITFSGPFTGSLGQHLDLTNGKVAFTGSVERFYPQWFGPSNTCNGALDDTAAVQSAVDAAGGRTVSIVGTCVISSLGPGGTGGVTLYPPNAGINLSGNQQIAAGSYVGGAGGGLVASATSPPTSLLSVYAYAATLSNLYLDCNSFKAANGITYVMSTAAISTHVVTEKCSGSGSLLNENLAQSTMITAGGSAGSSSITVASVMNNRLTFGATYCTWALFGSNHELHAITSLPGVNPVTISGVLANSQTTVSCDGSAGSMTLINQSGYSNMGWMVEMAPGDNQNAVTIVDSFSSANVKGGILAYGSRNNIGGGTFSGDGGPWLQLGTSGGTALTVSNYITPPTDLEESPSANNAVSSLCDEYSYVQLMASTELTFGTQCTTSGAGSTIGNGIDGAGNLIFISRLASTTITPGSNTGPNGVWIRGSSTVTDFAHCQLESGNAGSAIMLMLCTRTDTGEGFIQATTYGTSSNRLDLNPGGGVINIGRSANYCAAYSFASNAAALTGGLVVGDFYCVTGTDPAQLAIVH